MFRRVMVDAYIDVYRRLTRGAPQRAGVARTLGRCCGVIGDDTVLAGRDTNPGEDHLVRHCQCVAF